MDLLQREHLEMLAKIGDAVWKKVAFGVRKLSLKRGTIAPRLLLRTNRNSHTCFQLVPESTTLDDLEWSLCTLFQNMHRVVIYVVYHSVLLGTE